MTPLTNRRFMTSPQHVMSPVSQHTQVVTKEHVRNKFQPLFNLDGWFKSILNMLKGP